MERGGVPRCTWGGLVSLVRNWSRNDVQKGTGSRWAAQKPVSVAAGLLRSLRGMLLAASHAKLKAKLSDKMRWRPTQMVMKKLPDE